MCGIFGVIRRGRLEDGGNAPGGAPIRELVRRLAEHTKHRGPDGEGFYEQPQVAMGMRRLAIIDLHGGWQPLYNEDQSVALVANGEVYNFVELRKGLEARGHRFRTGSDCETIAHLYEEHGDDFVHHLRGMFACAIWDTKRKRLVIARDRMGEKPLYIAETPDGVIFSSELRPLVASGAVDREFDPAAVVDFFHYGFVPDPFTPIRGVRKLPAGSMLVIETEPWTVRERRFWSIHESPPITGDPVKMIREELERIIEITVRSDVPVGVCLSAGVDSSAVAALASARYKETLNAVSVGFSGGARQDESHDAEAIAKHLKIPFHRVEVTDQDAGNSFAEVAIARDQPFVDLAGISLHHLMRRCRELGLVVMLSGQGGDELFFGYPMHQRAIDANLRKLGGQQGLGAALRYLKPTKPPRSLTLGVRWLQSLGGIRSGLADLRADRIAPANRLRFWDLESGFTDARRHLPGLAGSLIADVARSDSPFRHALRSTEERRIDLEVMGLYIDIYLRENGLAQADRISMWHGVELRNPLVDYRLAEMAMGLRKGHVGPPPRPKQWLRAAIADLVPEWVLHRPKKGFSSPWRAWLNAIGSVNGSKLDGGSLVRAGILTPEAGRHLARSVSPGPVGMPDHMAVLALWLECWARGIGFPGN
jgi:asparagine synthase (glutamine-hydrolysing)